MPTTAELNNAFSKFTAPIPEVGQSQSIPVTEILAAIGYQDVPQALALFTQWANANGLSVFQLTADVVILGRHLAQGAAA